VDTIMISPGAAEVTYAGAESPVDIAPENVNAVLADALAVAESDARLFNRPDETEPRRRLGLALATAPDVTTARDRTRRVTGVLRKLW
jgi:phosphoribosylglycinamide formyltransferase 2